MPLGAGRLTRERLAATRRPAADVDALTEYVESALDRPRWPSWTAAGTAPVATSKTFRTLARLAGAAPSAAGLRAPRQLTRTGLHQVLGFIRHIPSAGAGRDGRRQRQPGAPAAGRGAWWPRRRCAGSGWTSVDICPWALREGVILRRLDVLEG